MKERSCQRRGGEEERTERRRGGRGLKRTGDKERKREGDRELRREAERRAGEPETTGKTRGSKRSEVRG